MPGPANACPPSFPARLDRARRAWSRSGRTSSPGGSRTRSSARAAVTATLLLVAGCHPDTRASFGEPVDPASAVRLATILGAEPVDRSAEAVVSGRVGEVCRAAGCWFVLQDGESGEQVQVMVDLSRAASFTVSPGIQGREAIVRGRFVGEGPDLQFNAVGLLVK